MSAHLHQPDAAALWAEWRHAIDHRFDDYSAAAPPRRPLAQRRLLLALELGWKLEEQVLLPALQNGDQARRDDVLAAEKEIGLLRELSWLLSSAGLPTSAHDVVLGVLAGAVTLRSVQIERALGQAMQAHSIDSAALVKDVKDLLRRWRGEVLASGDIEDEDADPVGQPPR